MNTPGTFILSITSTSKPLDLPPNLIDKHLKHFLLLQNESKTK